MGGVKSRLNCISWLNFNCWNRRRYGIDEPICTNPPENESPIKMYSWDLRPKLKSHRIEKRIDEEIILEPGSINGEQVIVENCKNCKIYILDHSSALNIDECEDCIFIVGPVRGSLFLRETTNSTLCSVSGQLRLRDCKQIHIFGGSESEPIIESSFDIAIGPYTLYYEGIEDHFKEALLYPDNLVTNTIYDFTPPSNTGEPLNWKPISGSTSIRFLPTPTHIPPTVKSFSTDEQNSYVAQYLERMNVN